MSASSVAARGRRRAEALMVDEATVWHKTGDTTFDEDLGREVPIWLPQFTSKCKVQTRAMWVSERESGGRSLPVATLEVHLPLSAPAVSSDDEIELTESSDSQLVGRRFRVVSQIPKTYATVRRYHVEEVG